MKPREKPRTIMSMETKEQSGSSRKKPNGYRCVKVFYCSSAEITFDSHYSQAAKRDESTNTPQKVK